MWLHRPLAKEKMWWQRETAGPGDVPAIKEEEKDAYEEQVIVEEEHDGADEMADIRIL